MREIDTAALEGVARSLGVQNPVTATEQVLFDDDNLQQAFDVGPVIRYKAARLLGRPDADGWFQFNVELTQAGAGTDVAGGGFQSVLDGVAGLERTDTLWLYAVHGHGTAAADLDGFSNAGLDIDFADEQQFGPGTNQGQLVYVRVSGLIPSQSALLGWGPNQGSGAFRYPIAIPPGSSWDAWLTLGSDAMTFQIQCVMRALPRGVPPYPY